MAQAYIAAASVIDGLRALVAGKYKRTVRTALMGFLLLKAKEPKPGEKFSVSSTGDQSVEPELKRFFRVAPGTPFPDVNPFGQSEGKLEYLRKEYERRGTFTHLYKGRNLEQFVQVEEGGGYFVVSVPPTAAEKIAEGLDERVPLRAAAAFLLREETFPAGATDADVVARLRSAFHLTDKETSLLFVDDPGFKIAFASDKFDNALASLPSDLRPKTVSASHATLAQAAQGLLVPAIEGDVAISIDPRLRQRIQRAVAASKAIALVGPPGTAKSSIWSELLEEAASDPSVLGLKSPPAYACYTADIDWTARTLIGGHYPQSNGELVFKEGYLLQAIRNNQLFWLDEMNRADLDRVLGPVLTFLAGKSVDLGVTHLGNESGGQEAKQISLVWVDGEKSEVKEDKGQRIYCVGTEWRMLGTYNNVDRGRVFPMGSALLRRWAIVPVAPVNTEAFKILLKELGTRQPVIDLLAAAYDLHLSAITIGPAPFLDIARYVGTQSKSSSDTALTSDERRLLEDGYILYMGQQLGRLDPEERDEFFKTLGGIFGAELAEEAASF